MNVYGKDPSTPSGVLSLNCIYPRYEACSQEFSWWENDVSSPRFPMLLLFFLIDCFQVVILILSSLLSTHYRHTCFSIISGRREQNSFFICCVVWAHILQTLCYMVSYLFFDRTHLLRYGTDGALSQRYFLAFCFTTFLAWVPIPHLLSTAPCKFKGRKKWSWRVVMKEVLPFALLSLDSERYLENMER